MKIRIIVIAIVPTLLIFCKFSCDGMATVGGQIFENTGTDSSVYLKDAIVVFYPHLHDRYIPADERGNRSWTDAYGKYFLLELVSPIGSDQGALMVSKDGYEPDTLFFTYRSLDKIRLDVHLRKISDHFKSTNTQSSKPK